LLSRYLSFQGGEDFLLKCLSNTCRFVLDLELRTILGTLSHMLKFGFQKIRFFRC
jgi:hypothetical protein